MHLHARTWRSLKRHLRAHAGKIDTKNPPPWVVKRRRHDNWGSTLHYCKLENKEYFFLVFVSNGLFYSLLNCTYCNFIPFLFVFDCTHSFINDYLISKSLTDLPYFVMNIWVVKEVSVSYWSPFVFFIREWFVCLCRPRNCLKIRTVF